ncbi:MAG: LuxR C-terminal-related transcriptional regulator, partial [Anaerolineales bacterium]
MLRLLIASPYPAMRAGLHALLEDADASRSLVTVVGEADSIESCLGWVRATQPEVVIFDLSLDPDETMGGLWRLKNQSPAVAVLALCESNADGRVLAALQAGAHGCLPKTATGPELLEAAQSAASGESILHPSATAALLEQLRGEAPLESLTPRETEVLRAVAAGQTNKAIALKLGISEHTVKFHLSS